MTRACAASDRGGTPAPGTTLRLIHHRPTHDVPQVFGVLAGVRVAQRFAATSGGAVRVLVERLGVQHPPPETPPPPVRTAALSNSFRLVALLS